MSGHTLGPWSVSAGSIWAMSPWGARVRIATVDRHSPMNGIDSVANADAIAALPELLTEAREICAILDCYRADTGEEPCFDHEAIGEEVARRHDSLTAAICKALNQ